jgi:selenide,water dikinase
MKDYTVHACTDITGFGLLGHLAEMVEGSGCSIRLNVHEIPIIPEAIDFASMGLLPAGAYKNKEFREKMVKFSSAIDSLFHDILFDPQTSGGLLICIEKDQTNDFANALVAKGVDQAAIIGEIISDPREKIFVHS